MAGGCVDITQPEVCALGRISEYTKVLSMAHAYCVPVINHVWGSAVAITTNIQLLAPSPGGLHSSEPMLEFDTPDNLFRYKLATESLLVQNQVAMCKTQTNQT